MCGATGHAQLERDCDAHTEGEPKADTVVTQNAVQGLKILSGHFNLHCRLIYSHTDEASSDAHWSCAA